MYKTELSKLYLEKILLKEDLQEVIENFIDKHLSEEERYITLKEFIRTLGFEKKDIKRANYEYSQKHKCNLDDKIIPLYFENCNDYFIQTIDFPIHIDKKERMDKDNSNKVKFYFSFLLTEDKQVILLKCIAFQDKLKYYTLKLDIKEEKPFYRESFIINFLPELLQYIHIQTHNSIVYAIINILFSNAINFLTQYSKYEDLLLIKQGLMKKNYEYGNISLEYSGKKNIKITLNDDEINVNYYTSVITPTTNPNILRSKNLFQIKDDVDAVIVKAIEEDNDRVHYIFVSNIIEERECMSGNKRQQISALFRRKNGVLELEKETKKRNLELQYSNIHEVDLVEIIKSKRKLNLI